MSESAPPEDPYEGIDGIELNSFLTTPPQLDPTSGDGTAVSSGTDTPDGGGTGTGDSSGAQTAAPSNGLARSQQKGAVAVSWTIHCVRTLALTPIMFLVWAITISDDLLPEQPGLWARGIILIGPMAASVLFDAVFQLLPPQFHWRVNVVAWMLSWWPSPKYASATHERSYASKDTNVSGAKNASRRTMDDTAIESLPEWRVALFYYLLMLFPYVVIALLWNCKGRALTPIMRWFGLEWPSVDAQGRAQQQRTASQTARTPQLQPSEVSAAIARVSAIGPFLTSVHRRFGRSSEKHPHQAATYPAPESEEHTLIDLTTPADTEAAQGTIQGYYIGDSDGDGPVDEHWFKRLSSKEKMPPAATLDIDSLKSPHENSETSGNARRGEGAIIATADRIDQSIEAGKNEEALAAIEKSVKMYRALYRTRGADHANDLATVLHKYSSTLSKTGRNKEARVAIEESVEMYRALHKARPKEYAAGMATALYSYFSILSKTGTNEEAQTAIEESIKMYRALNQARPRAYADGLATVLDEYFLILRKTGNWEEALAVRAESLEVLTAVHQALRATSSTPTQELSALSNSIAADGQSDTLPVIRDENSGLDIKPNDKVVAIYPYSATLADEMDLEVDDIITVLRIYDDGWAVGRRASTAAPTAGGSSSNERAFPLVCVTSAQARTTSSSGGMAGASSDDGGLGAADGGFSDSVDGAVTADESLADDEG
ncbi:hypothetical protein OC846_006021 [Tilletia horrida]|uniref:SH3 domain-containing protein n=1 Tax=Tilletia horrida TaxID=155126 RepID=A0AAN6GK76_9BASI|nr:hypothetical protein OC846_006021 [Tilletia horrida]KAK0560769.1 hypothetical protein OC861_006143 [Tilletia horrida]